MKNLRLSMALPFALVILLASCAIKDKVIQSGEEPGTILWTFSTEGGINSCPAIGNDGTIYIGSHDFFYAVNPDGTQKWRFARTNEFSSTPAIGPGGTIYLTSGDTLYAISTKDGQEKWHFTAENLERNSPAVNASGDVFIGARDSLYAFFSNGRQKWSFGDPAGRNYSSASIDKDGVIYVGEDARGPLLFAMNPDGTKRWGRIVPGDAEIAFAPSIGADSTLYVTNTYHDLIAINTVDGSEKWDPEEFSRFPPIIGADGVLYIEGVVALDPEDGSRIWSQEIGNNDSPVIGADNLLYVGGRNQRIYALDLRSEGAVVWETELGGSPNYVTLSPDSILYAGCTDGLYAIKTSSSGLARSAWPKFRHDNYNSGFAGFLDPPNHLEARQIPNQQVHLTWRDNSASESGFQLWVQPQPPIVPPQKITVGAGITSYQWNWDPEDVGRTYSFKVAAFDDHGVSDFSNEVSLKLVKLIPSVSVQYPNGSEKWTVGSKREIKWEWPGMPPPLRVTVQLSIDGGSHWKVLHPEADTPNDGSLEIVVPKVNSDNCVVKIQGGAYYDLSNEAFSIL